MVNAHLEILSFSILYVSNNQIIVRKKRLTRNIDEYISS